MADASNKKKPGKRAARKPSGKKGGASSAGSALHRLLRGLAVALLVLGAASLVVAVGTGALVYRQVRHEVTTRMSGQRWELPTRLYPAPLRLRRGQPLPPGDFGDTLAAMGYQKREPVKRAGEFRPDGKARWYVAPYDPLLPSSEPAHKRVLVEVAQGRVTGLTDVDSRQKISALDLPGAAFAELHESLFEARRIYPLSEFPKALRDAIVAIEDERFYRHGALDPLGILRALYVNLRAGEMVQGGSTLTQQVVKNFFLTQERTLERKVREVLYATALEQGYSKDEILELYLNEIYLGQQGSVSICGMGEAAWRWFSRRPSQLTLAESALLAAMIQGPNLYDPIRHTERARARRDVVLAKMASLGFISDKDKAEAQRQPVEVREGRRSLREAPWFVDKVVYDLKAMAPQASLAKAGWSVQTTLDRRVLAAAEQALTRGLTRLSKSEELEGAIVVLEPRSGRILALVGGRSWQRSQFNRALLAKRQPGSIFKPIVFAAALREMGPGFGPGTTLMDEPLSLPTREGGEWKPQNYDRTFRGQVTARQTLEQSINLPTVRLAQQIGLPPIVELSRRLGITSACAASTLPGVEAPDCSRDDPSWLHPSLALGAKEVTPLEMAAAYTALATRGTYHPPVSVLGARDPEGLPIAGAADRGSSDVLKPEAAWLLRDMLRGVLDVGTGKAARSMGYTLPAAGKTGTTSSERDAWFVGFDSDYLVVVWVGYDSNRQTGFSGAEAALPIWVDLMKRLRGGQPPDDDPPPPGIVKLSVCPESQALTTPLCPESVEEVFWAASAPTERCPVHGGPLLSPPAQKFFDWFRTRFPRQEGAPF